jgi:protein-L-isoaspartate O-methyltransferase
MQAADVREQMIEQQVRAWDVLDTRVLEVLRRVPRELFVPVGGRHRQRIHHCLPALDGGQGAFTRDISRPRRGGLP